MKTKSEPLYQTKWSEMQLNWLLELLKNFVHNTTEINSGTVNTDVCLKETLTCKKQSQQTVYNLSVVSVTHLNWAELMEEGGLNYENDNYV